MTLTAEVRHEPGTAVIALAGDIDGDAEGTLVAAEETAVGGGPRRLVLGFDGVRYINSSGIAVLVGLLARARRDRREVAAAGLSDHYRRVFELTRLADFMTLYDTEDAAVHAAATSPSAGGTR